MQQGDTNMIRKFGRMSDFAKAGVDADVGENYPVPVEHAPALAKIALTSFIEVRGKTFWLNRLPYKAPEAVWIGEANVVFGYYDLGMFAVETGLELEMPGDEPLHE